MRNTAQARTHKRLSDLETRVMRFIWSNGAVTSEQVRAGLSGEHDMKDATVRTILRRLEEKGYVEHKVAGRTYVYRGVEKPENVAARGIRQLLDRVCGGSVERLLVGMVDQEVITPGELKDLARKIAERQKKG